MRIKKEILVAVTDNYSQNYVACSEIQSSSYSCSGKLWILLKKSLTFPYFLKLWTCKVITKKFSVLRFSCISIFGFVFTYNSLVIPLINWLDACWSAPLSISWRIYWLIRLSRNKTQFVLSHVHPADIIFCFISSRDVFRLFCSFNIRNGFLILCKSCVNNNKRSRGDQCLIFFLWKSYLLSRKTK